MYCIPHTVAIMENLLLACEVFENDKLFYVVQGFKDNKFECDFVKTSNPASNEFVFKKNGVIATHSAQRMGCSGFYFWVVPDDTPDCSITIGKLHSLDATSDLRGAETVLYRNIVEAYSAIPARVPWPPAGPSEDIDGRT
jgi:hypothetical protein